MKAPVDLFALEIETRNRFVLAEEFVDFIGQIESGPDGAGVDRDLWIKVIATHPLSLDNSTESEE